MTASVSTPVSREASSVITPSTASTDNPEKTMPMPMELAKATDPAKSMTDLASRMPWSFFRPLSSEPITAIAPTANTSEPLTKPSVMGPIFPNFFCSQSPARVTPSSMCSSSPMTAPMTSDSMGMSWLLLPMAPEMPMPMDTSAVAPSTVCRIFSGMSLPPNVPRTPPAATAAALINTPVSIMVQDLRPQ